MIIFIEISREKIVIRYIFFSLQIQYVSTTSRVPIRQNVQHVNEVLAKITSPACMEGFIQDLMDIKDGFYFPSICSVRKNVLTFKD